MIRDVAVRVQEPEDFLAETIFPSHIVVPRCQGEQTNKSTNIQINKQTNQQRDKSTNRQLNEQTHTCCQGEF